MKYPRAIGFPKLTLRRWKLQRIKRRNLVQAHKKYQTVLHDSARTQEALLLAVLDLQSCTHSLEQFESGGVILKAECLAVDVPNKEEKPTWWTHDYEDDTLRDHYWLSERGRAGVLRLIREERRKTWEWRIRVLTPILTILIGILGLLVALVSMLLKLAEPTTLR
jgi:hypothetical protein